MFLATLTKHRFQLATKVVVMHHTESKQKARMSRVSRRTEAHLAGSRCSSETFLPGLFVLLALLEEGLWDLDVLCNTKQPKSELLHRFCFITPGYGPQRTGRCRESKVTMLAWTPLTAETTRTHVVEGAIRRVLRIVVLSALDTVAVALHTSARWLQSTMQLVPTHMGVWSIRRRPFRLRQPLKFIRSRRASNHVYLQHGYKVTSFQKMSKDHRRYIHMPIFVPRRANGERRALLRCYRPSRTCRCNGYR